MKKSSTKRKRNTTTETETRMNIAVRERGATFETQAGTVAIKDGCVPTVIGTVNDGAASTNGRAETTSNKLMSSAVEKHVLETRHRIQWENTKILWTDNQPHKLLIKESILIKAHEPAMNRTTHSVPLYIFRNGIDRKFLPKIK